MKRRLRMLVALWVPLIMIGHGGGSLPCCDGGIGCKDDCDPFCDGASADSIDYDVVGTCGPSGRVTVSRKEDQCDLRIDGDDVGIPTRGTAGGTIDAGGWDTSEGSQHCIARSVGGDTSRLTVACTESRGACVSFFIRVDQSCGTQTCNIPLCDDSERLVLGPDACCPTCEAIALDAGHDAALLDASADLDASNDEPTWCDSARISYQDAYDGYARDWSTCTEDNDCTVVDIENACGHHCGVALHEDFYEGDTCDAGECVDIETVLEELGDSLCTGCSPSAPCDTSFTAQARCLDHQCVPE